MADALPRLLYVADVPVESSQHGSALMFRALEGYPPERLRVVETGAASRPERRLPGVAYDHLPVGRRRLLDSRLHGLYSAWLTHAAAGFARRVDATLAGFEPDAVLTVGHGFGWRVAAAAARRRGIPFHLVVHDDWPRVSGIAPALRGWLDRRFGDAYRAARTRLCISPFMADAYRRRYGVDGSVLFPSRAADCPVFPPIDPRALGADGLLVVGYGGNSGPEMMSCLRDLVRALDTARARLVVFGPFDDRARAELRAVSPGVEFRGFLPFDRMIAELRASADVLFVPMSFEPADRDNMEVSFPSKLADYTATGLPLLIYGPPYSSAVRWAGRHPGVAAVVHERAGLGPALARLRADAAGRQRLAERASIVGTETFGAASAGAALRAAVAGPAGAASGAVGG